MADFDSKEIARFGYRLEEQASNFQVSTDNIDYDFRSIGMILRRYIKNESIEDLCKRSDMFADGWSATRDNLKYGIILIAARMTGYDAATTSNASLGSGDLQAIKEHFDKYYSDPKNSSLLEKKDPKNTGMYWSETHRTGWGDKRPDYSKSFEENYGGSKEDLIHR